MFYDDSDDVSFFRAFLKAENNEKIFVSIKAKEQSIRDIDFEFIIEILFNLSKYQLRAKEFLFKSCNSSPVGFGFSEIPKSLKIENIVSHPELMFWKKNHWSIIFREGLLPICDPYGILVNFQEDRVLDYENLMDYDEV